MPPIFSAASFYWDFADGTNATLAQPTHAWNNPTDTAQVYEVVFSGVSAFGCVDSHRETIAVLPQPPADFSVISSGTCSPLGITLTSTSIHADLLS